MAITAAQQQAIIKYTVGLFNAPPGGYFAELAAFVDGGNTPQTMALILGGSPAFTNQSFAYSNASTNEQFTNAFLNNLLGDAVTTETMEASRTAVLNLLESHSRAQVMVAAIDFIAGASVTNSMFGDAAQQLANRIEVASTYTIDLGGESKDLTFLKSTIDSVTEDQATVDAALEELEGTGGQEFTLTTGVDELSGTAGDDTFIALLDKDAAASINNNTLTPLDSLDGGAGTDTLRLNVIDDDGDGIPSIDITNIENFNLRTAVTLTEDLTDYGFTTINVNQNSAALSLTAGATTAFNVAHAGATASTTLDGGSTQTVNVGNGAVTLTGAAGAISVTHADQVAGENISTTHGTDVTVVSSADEAAGAISVGDGTDNQSGAVNITQNLTSDGATFAGGNISVDGGTTVDVAINGTITADAAADDGGALTAGAVAVTSDGNTTDVNITQNLTATDYSKAATDDVPATQVLTFDALAQGEAVVVDGLTFTASKALTAEEVAAAFANLGDDSGAGATPAVGDIASSGGPVANGVFTGNTSGDWTSGAADGANVTFTADQGTAAMTVNTGDITPDSDYDAGTDNSATAESADVSVTYGAVTIDEDGVADASIENITVNGYAASTIGGTANVDALKTLSLANSAGTMGVTTAAASLDLTVDDVSHGVTLTAPTLLDLTLNAVGDDSAFALASAATTDLTIDATADLDLTGSTLTDLQNATITGAGAVILAGQTAATLETLDASGNTGGVAASVNGDATVVTGGDGDDEITVLNAGTAISKTISLGAGDDAIDISNGGTVTAVAPTATIDGGADTDLLAMDSAAAAGADAAFAGKFTNFEQLEIVDQVDINAASVTVDLSVLEYNYIVTNGTESGAVGTSDGTFTNALIFDNAANGSTFELNDAQIATGATGSDIGSIQINLEDATGASDSLNLITDAVAGLVEAQGVETINVSGKDSVTLKGTDLATVTVNGNDVATTDSDGNPLTYSAISVVLDASSTNVELVDASASMGAFTFDSLDDTTATVINGGQGDDEISISGAQDSVDAGAGDDTITIASTASASVVTGGAGNDLFDITGATLGLESYATITDAQAGDQIAINAASFKSQGVVVTDPSEMTLTDWLTAAFNQTDATEAIWFQHNDNTYVVDNAGTNDFVATDDVVVKLTGLVDLDTAAFNDAGIIEVA